MHVHLNISWKFCRFRLDLDHFSFKLPSKQTYQVSQMENFKQQIWFRKSCCCLLPSKQTCPLATVILNCGFCLLKKSCYYLLPSKQINQLFRVTLRFSLFLRLFFEKLFCCRLPLRKIFQLVMATLKYNFYHLDYSLVAQSLKLLSIWRRNVASTDLMKYAFLWLHFRFKVKSICLYPMIQTYLWYAMIIIKW